MDDFTIARVLHVLAVSMWMGGVAFVTTIVMPFIRRSSPPAERLEAFHHFEGRVAPQTSFWVLLAGASGFWMTWRADLWDRFAALQFCWMHAMVALRLFFAVMRFIIAQIGSASLRERVCQFVWILVVAVPINKNNNLKVDND